jgi:hypothetical protein
VSLAATCPAACSSAMSSVIWFIATVEGIRPVFDASAVADEAKREFSPAATIHSDRSASRPGLTARSTYSICNAMSSNTRTTFPRRLKRSSTSALAKTVVAFIALHPGGVCHFGNRN